MANNSAIFLFYSPVHCGKEMDQNAHQKNDAKNMQTLGTGLLTADNSCMDIL